MADGHQRFERLAVGHVVGGLDDVDGAAFRAHLVGCRSCRARVNELRGIASELDAAARDERLTNSDGSTTLRTREDEQAPPRAPELAPVRSWPWRIVVLGIVPVLVMLVMAWALWIRTEAQLLEAAVATQQSVLEVLATGDPVQWTLTPPTRGVAAASPDQLALDLSGLPLLGANEGLVVWQLDDAGVVVMSQPPLLRTRLAEGRLAAAIERHPQATELLVTVERMPFGDEPAGGRIASGPIPPVVGETAGTTP